MTDLHSSVSVSDEEPDCALEKLCQAADGEGFAVRVEHDLEAGLDDEQARDRREAHPTPGADYPTQREGLMAISTEQQNDGQVEQRMIQVSRIVIPGGFNPRGEVADDRELEQLAESIRRHCCLQPIRVQATGSGTYVLYLQ